MRITSSEDIGIGESAPKALLHLKASGGKEVLRLEELPLGSVNTNNIIGVDDDGNVKNLRTRSNLLDQLSIPSPAVFRLESTIGNFLNGYNAGTKQVVPMRPVKIGIKDLKYNQATSTITFPPGTYHFTFIYEASHNASNCTISSYLVDLSTNNGTTRIHTTASHLQGDRSNHGGTISHVSKLQNTTNWTISFGRGQSGNCSEAGMNLVKESTELLIFRIGD